MNTDSLIVQLKGGLIASCQPVENGPMDRTDIVVAMARAAVQGGARGLRIEGEARVRAVAQACSVPIVGIIKRDLADSPIRITPYVDDVLALSKAGAAIIAFDGTGRSRPVPREALIEAIHAACKLAMADCSNFADAQAMANAGCELIATTMSGYTSGRTPEEPDIEFVRECAAAGFCTVAEGRFNSPELAANALEQGAHAVTVGSAISRVEHIAGWFTAALDAVAKGRS